jgi:FlaA1/EpsC-like NDP-sugar epimerase
MKRSQFEDFEGLFQQVVGRRETQLLDDIELQDFFCSSRILIVGAGGSIGSAIAKRLISAKVRNVFFLDRDESSLHRLALELSDMSASHSDNCFVADIRDIQSLKEVFGLLKPTIVIHAAALKHLVILERFPREGFLTNIIGTLNVAKLCTEFEISQFVNISTDKAANPISVLGKTKKIAELLTEEIFMNSILTQCSVRFGNVFASRGSVIETFVHQITHDIPVTVTHPEVARFFMSRNEAANLVLAVASLKESGTYIQNMGEEVLLMKVVERIAQHFGKRPTINTIGLFSGEKLHEELFDGPTLPTKFIDISRSIHSIKSGLTVEIEASIPTNNAHAIKVINELESKYLKNL